MAKDKRPLSGKSVDLDIFDLDKIDDGFGSDFGIDEKKGPIGRFFTGFKRGFLEQSKNKAALGRAIQSALPDGYGRTMGAVLGTGNSIRSIVDEVKRNNAGDLGDLTRMAEATLPKLRGKTSEKLYSRIEEKLRRAREELNAMTSSATTPEQMQEAEDNAVLANLLTRQAEIQRDLSLAKENADSERFEKERLERNLSDKLNNLRFAGLSKQLGIIGTLVHRQVDYQDQITHQYQRKSLEVQYRQLFMLRDLRKYAEVSLDVHKRAYDVLAHNTSLPDHRKGKESEKTHFRPGRALVAGTASNLAEFLANFYPTIRQNVTGKISESVGGIGGLLSMAAGGLGNIDKLDMGGQLLGSGAANQLLTRLAVMARGPLEKASNKVTGGQQNRLSYLLKNMPSLLRDYTTDLGQSGGWRGGLQSMIKAVVPTYFQDDTLEEGTYQSIDRAASFNHLTQRSIVEVIPGYLSRILHEARILRTGDVNTEREVYDITGGKFTGYSEAKRKLLGRLIPETQRRNVNDALSAFISGADTAGSLSPEAQEALRERLLRDAASGGRFDPSQYLSGGYSAETPDKTVQELQQFLRGQFEFDDEGKLRGNKDNWQRREQLSDLFLNLQSVVPDVRGELKRITGAGSQELIRDLGLVVNQYGTDRIDYDKIWKNYRGENPGTSEPQGDLSRDSSGIDIVIQETKLQNGEYVDADSGKVIDKIEDVTGDIKDRMGRLVVRGNELGNGLYNRDGKRVFFRNLKERFKRALASAGDMRRTAQSFILNALRQAGGMVQDVYTATSGKVALLARDIRNGEYIDVNTDKIIRDISDVTGEVRDQLGNVVLTTAEFAEGLVNSAGEKIKGEEGPGFWNKYLRVTTAPMRALSRALGRGIKRVASWLWNRATRPRDAYIPGEDEPRLKANLLKTGFYIDDETQQPISEFYQIKGSVSDINGNQVVSGEELAQLIYRDGSKHEVAKKPGLLRRMARGYWRFTKNYYKWLGKTAAKVGGKMLRGAGSLLGKLFGRGKKVEPKDIETPTDGLLYRIMTVLDDRLPGKALRKGSWQDLLARRGGKKDDQGKPGDDDKDGKRGPLSGIAAGLKKLLGWGGDEEEEGDDGDTFIDMGGDGDGKDGKDGKGKKKRKKKPKGRLGRLKGKLGRIAGKGMGLLGKGLGLAGVAYGGYSAYDNLTKGNYGDAALDAGLAAGGLALTTGSLGAVGGALGTAAAAVGSVLSLPVLLAAGAVAGAGYLGYKYYQKRSRASGLFKEFRLMQYGVSPAGWSEPGKLLDLEALLSGAVSSNGTQPTLDISKVPPEKVLELFGVNPRDVNHMASMLAWLEQRFQPVFISYHAALKALAPNVLLDELDDKLPPELGMQFLERVKYPYTGSTPYAITASPFDPNDPLEITMEDIQAKEKAIVEHYKGKAAGDTSKVSATTAAKVSAAAGTLGTQGVMQSGTAMKGSPSQTFSVMDAAMGTSSDVFQLASNTKAVEMYNRPLTSLETIRLKAYGLVTLTQGSVRDVFALENYVMQQIKMDGAGQAMFSGSVEDIVKQFSSTFAVGEKNGERYAEFSNWLRLRFLPVAVNYASGVLRVVPNAPLTHSQGRLERLMDPVMKVSVAKAIIGATVDDRGAKTSVWTIGFSPNGVLAEGLKDLEQAARAHLKLLESEADNFELKTVMDNQTQQKSTSGSNVVAFPGSKSTTGSSPTGQAGSSRSGNLNLPVSRIPSPLQPGGVNIALGNVFTGVQGGTGGMWESIPFPASNGTLGGALPTLQAVSKMTGVDLAMLLTICSIESSFNFLAKAPTSSASGWFQFINSTWDDIYKRCATQYGLPANDPGRTLRMDPRVNALMGAEFLKGNYRILESGLKRKPTDTDIYLAHFFGAGTAVKFLKTDPNANAAQAFPAQAKANQPIFYHPSGQARTIGEVYRLMDEKVNRHRYGGSFNVQSSANDSVSLAPTAANDGSYAGGTPQPMKDDAPAASGKALFGLQSAGTLASATSRSLNPSTPNTVAPATAGSGAGSMTTEGAMPDVVTTQQTQTLQQARSNDRRQQAQVEETMASNREIHGVLEKQLAVQESMRDYLKQIAGNLGVGLNTPNPTTRATADKVHKTGTNTPPVSMKHAR